MQRTTHNTQHTTHTRRILAYALTHTPPQQIPPQVRTRCCTSSSDPFFGETFHLTSASRLLDGLDKRVLLTGESLQVLLTVHDRDLSWIGRASASLAPRGEPVELRVPLASPSGEPVRGPRGEHAAVVIRVVYSPSGDEEGKRGGGAGDVGMAPARDVRRGISPARSGALSAEDLVVSWVGAG